MKRKADQSKSSTRKKQKFAYDVEANLFSVLPGEVLQEIINYLNDNHRRRVRMINCHMFRFVNMSHFNIGLILDSEMSELTRVFGRYHKPIGLTFRKLNKVKHNISRLSQLTQLTSLDIGLNHKPVKLDLLTNLETLTAAVALNMNNHKRLKEINTKDMPVIDHQQYLTQLERLSIDSLSYSALECFNAMPNLKHLRLTGPTKLLRIECHLTGLESLATNVIFTDLPVNTLTSLTVLNSRTTTTNTDIAHLTNLRQLAIVGRVFTEQLNMSPFTLLESLVIRGTWAHITQLVSTNITQLEAPLFNTEDVEHLLSFTNLRQLSLTVGFETSFDFTHFTQLTSVQFWTDRSFFTGTDNFNAFTSVKSLRELHLETVSEQIHDLLVFTKLSHLTYLALKNIAAHVDVSNMTNLEKIEINQLADTLLIGLSTLHNLTHLSCVTFNFDYCSSLTALQELNIHKILISEELELLAQLSRLTSLTGYTTGSGMSLIRLTRLQKLQMTAAAGSKKIRKCLLKKLALCHSFLYTILEDDETYVDGDDDDD